MSTTLAAFLWSSNSLAGAYIHTEAVNDYTLCGGATDTLPNSIADIDGFTGLMTQMFSNPAGYVHRQRWVNGYVWPADFKDPQNSNGGLDTYYFDQVRTAFSMFAGHGINPAGTPYVVLSTAWR